MLIRPMNGTGKAALRVGFDSPFEPFAWVDGDESKGMLIEIVGAVLEKASIFHQFIPLSLDVVEPALLEHRIDAIAFKGITPERERILSFSGPLLVTGGAIFTRRGIRASANLCDFAGKTVVTPRRGPLYSQIESGYPDLTLIDGHSYQGSFESVLAGRADLAALNWQAGIRMANRCYAGLFELPGKPYVAVELAFAVPKGRNSDVLRRFGDAQAELRHAGTLDRIAAKWLAA